MCTGGRHDGSSGVLVQSSGGHDIPIAPGMHGGVGGQDGSVGLAVQSTLHDESSGFLLQSGLHDGSLGDVVQSTRGAVVQDASLGFALQSTDGDT
jgi:hypothetical protein